MLPLIRQNVRMIPCICTRRISDSAVGTQSRQNFPDFFNGERAGITYFEWEKKKIFGSKEGVNESGYIYLSIYLFIYLFSPYIHH
jgi:hypothetical protein